MPNYYERRARIAPVFVVVTPLLPLALSMLVALPGWLKIAAGGWLILLYVVQELGRDRGLARQPALWKSWGGPPTTQLLRWEGSSNQVATERRHRQLEKFVAESARFPTPEEEHDNPGEADQRYEAAVDSARNLTRDGEARLLRENASYGFRRNSLGLRPFGIGIALIGVAVSVGFIWFNLSPNRGLFIASGVVAAVAFAYWGFVVNAEWVRRQAVSYAVELFATIDRRVRSSDAGGRSPCTSGEPTSTEESE